MLRVVALTLLVLAGCATHRSPARTLPAADQQSPCSDADLRSMCTPARTERPVRVDTNLYSPAPSDTLAG